MSPQTHHGAGERGSASTGTLVKLAVLLVAAIAALISIVDAGPLSRAAGSNSITSPDTSGAGWETSVVLDASNFPVVSYYDASGADLKVMHCNDTLCSGGDESITSPDTGGIVGRYSSIALDGSGFPVVSYYDATGGDLKVLHCGDANCTTGNSITAPDTGGNVGEYTSLVIEGSGLPIISYFDIDLGDLKVLHCGNANCSSGNSIASPVTAGTVGTFTSIALDFSNNPYVSFYRASGGDLGILHCGNANCTAGNTITYPDTTDTVGHHTSMMTDDSGRPAVSYQNVTSGDLKVLRCTNADCTTNSIETVDSADDVGYYSSLWLDEDVYPVVAYWDQTNANLKVLHCNDANCSGGDESIVSPDTDGDVGRFASIVLDFSDSPLIPVVSYFDASSAELKLLRCGDATCAGAKPPPLTVDSNGDASDVTPGDGVCDIGGGTCTLRAAIEESNALAGTQTIAFDLAVPLQTIVPASALPAIFDTVVIDGTTEPDFVGLPIIEINAISMGGSPPIDLAPGSVGSTIRGLTINRSGGAGIIISTDDNFIEGNHIGTNIAGTSGGVGNAIGIVITDGASNNTIGGTTSDQRNIISGNGAIGVEIKLSSNDNRVLGNYIGVSIDGESALPNGAGASNHAGVSISASASNVIGTAEAGGGNVISGNDAAGILISGTGGNFNAVNGNYIGTDATGTVDVGNLTDGVLIQTPAQNNTIGGPALLARNIISGNGSDGIEVNGLSASGNIIQGNYIGVDATGTVDLGNDSRGVYIIDGPGNFVGGAAAGAGNVISGNNSRGVWIDGPDATLNEVRGNLIGTNAAGTAAIGNHFEGIEILDAPDNIIGGSLPGQGNVISGNGAEGLAIRNVSATGNIVEGNLIGTDAAGTSGIGNQVGVFIGEQAADNRVGGIAAGAGNVIAFNTGDGVAVGSFVLDPVSDITIRGNSIHSNGGQGIDLGDDGVTANDGGDPDPGANDLQNFPVLTGASTGSTIVNGNLDSTPSTLFTLDFYSNSACDGSGNGEGETYLGSTEVTTNAAGDVAFSTALPVTSLSGEFVTATATDPGGNTSEFSACVTVSGAPAGDVVGIPDNPGFNGDGPGATTLITSPTGMYETGTANSLYFADTGNNIVRKYKADGSVATLAGIDPNLAQTPCAGSVGDGCPARQALLAGPRDVFVHTNGDLYIADRNNCRIRKVVGGADNVVNGDNADEVITTVAGDGTCAFGGDGGPATSAQLNLPAGVAVDAAGNIYIADTDNHRIRRVDAGTGVITTVAGDGSTGTGNFGDGGPGTSAQLNLPHDVFLLRPGEEDLLIADTLHHRIRRIDLESGDISTVAGTTAGFSGDGGAALDAQLNGPEAVASADDRIFIADTKNNRIRRVNILTGIIDTIIGDGGLTTTVTLDDPQGVAVGGGTIGVSSTDDHVLITATIDPDTGDESQEFTPTQSCGILPGVSSIDWALPIGLLGLVLFRRRVGGIANLALLVSRLVFRKLTPGWTSARAG